MAVNFSVGDTVTWRSQSAGISKRKTGVVVEVLQPGIRPDSIRNAGWTRKHQSYLVRVDGRLYWPRVKNLRLVSGGEVQP